MFRYSLLVACVAWTTVDASAQSDASSRILPITGPIRHGGTLNVATGTWTRHSNPAIITAGNTIYDNTCTTSGYYAAHQPGQVWTDEGRLPSFGSPDIAFAPGVANTSSAQGCANSYEIDGFQISYCVADPTFSIAIDFIDAYAACTNPHDLTINPGPINASILLTGLPANGGLPSVQACWTINVDLAQSGQAFTMRADVGSSGIGYSNGTSDLFGWSFEITSPIAQPSQTGLLLAGDPFTCAGYDGTIFGNVNNPGTGMSTLDQFHIDTGTPTTSGCFWFGGAPSGPFASFYLELYDASALCPPSTPGSSFCTPGVDAIACPCAGVGQFAAADHGCGNSVFNAGAVLAATGTTAPDTVQFTSYDVPPGTSTVYLQGDLVLHPGVVAGDGILCSGGNLLRLMAKIDTDLDAATEFGPMSGDPQVSSVGGVVSGQTYTYQAYYRNPNATWCPSETFNVTQGYRITW